MSSNLVKKHWIIFRKLDTRLSIYVNLLPSKDKKDVNHLFKQDLTKERPYLIIIEEGSDNLLILTLTKTEKPSWGRFGPIKCPCLTLDTYVILNTKIIMTWEFARKYSLESLTTNNKIEHNCLSREQFLSLREALTAYWNKENEKLTLIELEVNKN